VIALLARRKVRRLVIETIVVGALCVALGWMMTQL
jgi:hypothetical protein